MTTEDFIGKAKSVHGDKYDYQKVACFLTSNRNMRIIVTCKIHGDFEQNMYGHLRGHGCPLCAREKHSLFMKGRGLIYTKEKCKEIAMTCTSRSELQKKNQQAYYVARINGWLDEYIWFSVPKRHKPIEHIKNNLIYVYIFDDVCYIGRTNNLKKRDKSHRQKRIHKNGKECSSCVLKYSEDKKIDIPAPIILEENLSLGYSREREEYWCNYYKKNGFLLLNKGKVGRFSGSIGACLKYDNYSEIVDVAKRYKKISDFAREHHSEYNAIRRMGELENLKIDCGMIDALRKPMYVFTKEGKFLFKCRDAREADKKTGVDYRLISMNAREKIKSTKGFIFKFQDNN